MDLFADEKQNKLISDAIKKVSNTADQGRVKNILNATESSDIQSYVPAGAKKEFQADLDKMKSMGPVTNESEEEEENVDDEIVEETPAAGRGAKRRTTFGRSRYRWNSKN